LPNCRKIAITFIDLEKANKRCTLVESPGTTIIRGVIETGSMPDQDEKARRKQLLHSQREEQRRSIRDGLPVPAAMMKALFTYVDKHLSSSECDDTLRHASAFIRANDLPADKVTAWLENKGGYCDCEVFNAEELLEDAVPIP